MLHRPSQIRAGAGFLETFTLALKASEEAYTVGGFMVLLDVRCWTVSKKPPLLYINEAPERGRFKCVYATLLGPFKSFLGPAKFIFALLLDRRSSCPATVG